MTRSASSPHDAPVPDRYGQAELYPSAPDAASVAPSPEAAPAHAADHEYDWDVVQQPTHGGSDGVLAARTEHPATPAAQSAGDEGSADVGMAGTPVAGSTTTPYDPAPAPERPKRSVGLVVCSAIAVTVVCLLVLGGCTVGAASWIFGLGDPLTDNGPITPPEGNATVLDADGSDVTGSVGTYDSPAIVGEHTVVFSTFEEGEIAATPTSIDLDATLPNADGEHVIQDGYRLVVITTAYRNTRTIPVDLMTELSVGASTDEGYYLDVAEGLVPSPLATAEEVPANGEIEASCAFLVPEAQISSLRVELQPFTSDIVHFVAP